VQPWRRPEARASLPGMNEVERRSLARALLLLVAVSGLRWGWQQRPAALPAPGGDAAPALLASTGEQVRTEARRSRPLAPGDLAHAAYEPGVSCHRCIGAYSEADRARFRERHRQVLLAQRRGETHIGSGNTEGTHHDTAQPKRIAS